MEWLNEKEEGPNLKNNAWGTQEAEKAPPTLSNSYGNVGFLSGEAWLLLCVKIAHKKVRRYFRIIFVLLTEARFFIWISQKTSERAGKNHLKLLKSLMATTFDRTDYGLMIAKTSRNLRIEDTLSRRSADQVQHHSDSLGCSSCYHPVSSLSLYFFFFFLLSSQRKKKYATT